MTRVCFVTGAARGIGRGLVERLSSAGHSVHAADVDLEGLEHTARSRRWPSRVRPAGLDVRDADSWARRYEQAESDTGPIDLHINCAGVLHPGWTEALDPHQVSRMIDVNFKGVVLGTQRAAASMALPIQTRGSRAMLPSRDRAKACS